MKVGALLLLLVVGVVLLFTNSPAAHASCWASNPEGTRVCRSFSNDSGLELELCEDNPGDCEKAGYHPLEKTAPPTRQKSKSHARNFTGQQAEESDASEHTSTLSSGGATGWLMLFVLGGIVLVAALGFAGLFGDILIFLFRFLFGIFSGGDD